MKLLVLFLLVGNFHLPEPTFLLIDTNLKEAPAQTSAFNWQQFLGKRFPIYTEDRQAIIEAAQKMAKLIEKDPACYLLDSVVAHHSKFSVYADCQSAKRITVRLQTNIKEEKFSCSFELVRAEGDLRKAQRRLIDFASYLENE